MNEKIYHAQGGGTAVWDEEQKRFVFVEPPSSFPNFQEGDFVPEEWGIE